jgi:hypothetical protein
MNKLVTPIIAAVFGTLGGYLAAGSQQPQIQGSIQAQSFELVDNEGVVRARFAMTRSGPALTMTDYQGRPRFGIAVAPAGTALSVFGPSGDVAAQLAVAEQGPGLTLSYADGAPGVSLSARTDSTAAVVVSDPRNRSLASIGVRSDGTGFVSLDEPAAPHKFLLMTSGAGTNPTLSMRAMAGHDAHFGFDAEGNSRLTMTRPATQGISEVSLRSNIAEYFGLLLKNGNEQSAGVSLQRDGDAQLALKPLGGPEKKVTGRNP